MELRQHQKDVQAAVNNIINGSASYKQIIALVTPGGGKSLLPQIAGASLIEAGLIDKIYCVVPRKKLQDQMAKDFLDPRARKVIGHQLSIRESTNEYDPIRDSDGCVTTYHAVSMDCVGVNADALDKDRCLLILDECHHIGLDGTTHQRIQPLFDRASFVLFMTGTLERNKGLPIAYTPYLDRQVNKNDPDTCFIEYSRSDGLKDRALIPITFDKFDGEAEWMIGGQTQLVPKLSLAKKSEAAGALTTAISSELGTTMLHSGLEHYQMHLSVNPRAKCLVVCRDITDAQNRLAIVIKCGFDASIATSDDSASAIRVLTRFQDDPAPQCLVCVGMAYEGLNVPAITHLILLNNYRSRPWLEQCLGRVTRYDDNPQAGAWEEQKAFVFIPADPLANTVIQQIIDEQEAILRELTKGRTGPRETSSHDDNNDMVVLRSSVTGIHRFEPDLAFKVSEAIVIEKTPRQIEEELRQRIGLGVSQWARKDSRSPEDVNRYVKRKFNKARSHMTIPELRLVEEFVLKADGDPFVYSDPVY